MSSSVIPEDRHTQEPKTERHEPKENSSRGSVLVDKHFEPIEAILKAYDSRIEKRQTMKD